MIRLSLCVLLVCFAHLTGRAQTVYGPGGLFIHPTAFLPEQRSPQINLSWFTQEANGVESRWVPASLTFFPNKRAQLGGLFVSRRLRGAERTSGGLFAKYQLQEGGVLTPTLAVSGSYLGGDVQQSSLSAVGSWRIPGLRGITGHSGYQWVRRADLPVSRDDLSSFLGVEVPIGPGFRLVGEMGSRMKFDRKAAAAVGVMWSGSRLSLGVGFVNTGRSDSLHPFIGAGYTTAGDR